MGKIRFGTGGFRGVIGKDFTLENASLIGYALLGIMERKNFKKETVIGYDRRELSKEAASKMAEIFSLNGIKTNLANTDSPTPCIIFETMQRKLDLGIMITASHNPAIYNGVKVFTKGGYDADVSFTDEIERECERLSKAKRKETREKLPISPFDPLKNYLDFLTSFGKGPLKHSIKLAYENLYGTGIKTLEPLFERLGIKEPIFLHKEKDSSFGGKIPNPIPKNLYELSKIIQQKKLDVGFAADSDADRLAVIDEKGNYVSANEILCSLYYYLVVVLKKKGDAVRNVATSWWLDAIAKKAGFSCYETDVGFKNITRKMKEKDAILGGESSGGLTMRGYLNGKDTAFAVLLFLNMMDDLQKPVSKIIQEAKDYASFTASDFEDVLPLKNQKEIDIAEIFENHDPSFSRKPIRKVILGRNIRYLFDKEEWYLIRLSNTEPSCRIYCEMKSGKDIEKEKENLLSFLSSFGLVD